MSDVGRGLVLLYRNFLFKPHNFSFPRFHNGGKYTGSYMNGKKHGEGTFFYPDGSKYIGYWINDERHGHGTYEYPNGDIYDGEWSNNQRHGQGVYSYAVNGSKYKGNWIQGKMEETGDLIHANHRYVGTFQQDRPKGKGKYLFDTGCELRGRYELVEVELEPETEEEEAVMGVEPRWRCEEILHLD